MDQVPTKFITSRKPPVKTDGFPIETINLFRSPTTNVIILIIGIVCIEVGLTIIRIEVSVSHKRSAISLVRRTIQPRPNNLHWFAFHTPSR